MKPIKIQIILPNRKGKKTMTSAFSYLGQGIYSIPEASRLTGVRSSRIRRWLSGYSYVYRGERKRSKPVWKSSLPALEEAICLSFLDLIEVQFVDAFLRKGLNWKSIRMAETEAARRFSSSHPFATGQFQTDGYGIFSYVDADGDKALVNLAKSQQAFDQIVSPFFLNLEIESDRVIRWWPMGQSHSVVVDPKRRFGHPITSLEGIPTSVLAKAVKVNGSVEYVASTYDASVNSVRDAVEFELQFALRRKAA